MLTESQKVQTEIRRTSGASAKRKLLCNMRCEPAWALGVVLKWAVCLLILVGLALLGFWTDLQTETLHSASTAGGSAQHRERPPAHAAPDQALPAAP
jgi:hypothetical protein